MVGHVGSLIGYRALPNGLGGWASSSQTTKFLSSPSVAPNAETSIYLLRRPEDKIRAICKVPALRGLSILCLPSSDLCPPAPLT